VGLLGQLIGLGARAVVDAEAEKRAQNAAWWWLSRGLFAVVLLVGWGFILWQNRFHIDAPVVVICLGYLALILTITNLWRVGAAAVAPEHVGELAWSRPLGERAELEKEKRTLLKSIKEAEFDQAMGKLSKADAEDLIRMYRTRAIELIKELDRLDAGLAGTPRERIEREVAARVAIEVEKEKMKARQKAGDAKGAGKGGKQKPGAKTEAKTDAKADAKTAAKTADAKAEATADAKTADAKAEATADAKADDTVDAKTADAKTDDKVDAKTADAKTDDAKADDKVDAKTDDKLDAKTDDAKRDAKADAKTDDAKTADTSDASAADATHTDSDSADAKPQEASS
jgi:hypothetical protein